MELDRSILWTVVYFDIFDYPLTSFEIYKWLYSPNISSNQTAIMLLRPQQHNFSSIKQELGKLTADKKIEAKDGFYFLPGRANIVWQRKLSFQISKRKIGRAKILAKIFAVLPYLRGIFLCNKVAQDIANEDSDIDLFIITEKNRIWTVRFLTTFLLKILGLRPSPKKTKDTFCLSFYVSQDSLSLEPYLLPASEGLPDIHYIYWLSAFFSLYDGGASKDFAQANNWIKKYLPNLELTAASSFSFSSRPMFKRAIEKFLDKTRLAPVLENVLKNLQLKLMPQELKQASQEANTNVVISREVLKFHLNDRREEYRQKFATKVVLSLK